MIRKLRDKLPGEKIMISFIPMMQDHITLWQGWSEKSHVKEVWSIEGYETRDYIYKKLLGNGYDYPFIIFYPNRVF